MRRALLFAVLVALTLPVLPRTAQAMACYPAGIQKTFGSVSWHLIGCHAIDYLNLKHGPDPLKRGVTIENGARLEAPNVRGH